jgi:Acetyltransferase (GNAT) domain
MPATVCSIYEKIGQCDADEWDEIVRVSRSGILTSHAFVAAGEEAVKDQARFAHAVVYDEGHAVACASFCAFPIDFNLLADGLARRISKVISKRVPSLMHRTIVFCGLPVSVGAKHLAITPGARHDDVLRALNEIAVSFARRERAPYIAFKEFPAGDCPTMDFLQQLGYRRFSSPAMNTFAHQFSDLDSYTAALRSRYRQCVRKSLAKSRAANLRFEHMTDTAAILRLYSPSLHRLYEAVALSSAHRLELLPLEFFHNLARRLPGRLGLTLVYVGDRVAAFNWNLFHGDVYYFLFAGLDYDLNPSLDLYFNLMYAGMDCAFRAGAQRLVFGQTADDFKVRLGCNQERRYFYVAPAGFFGHLILKVAGEFLLPEPPQSATHHVFRDPEPVFLARSC